MLFHIRKYHLVELFPQVFISIFTNDSDLMTMATWAIRIYMACVLLMGLQISCQQTFIAFGNAKISVFLAIFRKIIVLIPLIFILPNILSDHIFAVFVAEPIADFIAVSTTVTLFFKNFKKTLEDRGYKVFKMSAATRDGVDDVIAYSIILLSYSFPDDKKRILNTYSKLLESVFLLNL